MKRLFNKTFFKFAAGFIGIVVVAMFGILVLGTYELETQTHVDGENLIAD